MNPHPDVSASARVSPSWWEVTLVVVLVTLITASHLDEIAPTIARILRGLAYGSTLLVIGIVTPATVTTCAARFQL